MFLWLSLLYMWSYWFEDGIIRFPGLLEQEGQEEDWRAAWINLHLDKVWTIIISESCLYLLTEPFASTFQRQYGDGLLNPSHMKLSFTTNLKLPEPEIMDLPKQGLK